MMNSIQETIEERALEHLNEHGDAETIVLDTYTYALFIEELGMRIYKPLDKVYVETFDKYLNIEVDENAEELVSFI